MANTKGADPIPHRLLGRTGVEVCIMGLGGYHLGTIQSKREAVRIVQAAVDEGITFMDNAWEYHDGEECREVHHRAIYDDKRRMMVIATHNTDNGDGWEWEGDNHYFFEHFSEKIAYPLTINILFYQMTH